VSEAVEIHSLVGAYVLNGVDELERVAFERHLRDCSSCALEVVELRETVVRLAEPVLESPPSALRDTLLSAISRTPQQRPLVGGGPGAARPGRLSTGTWRRRVVAAVAASLLAGLVGVGTWAVGERRLRDERSQVVAEQQRLIEQQQLTLGRVTAEQRQVAELLAAPDASIRTTAMRGGLVTVVLSKSRNTAAALLKGMGKPQKGAVYQIWMSPGEGRFLDAGILPAGDGILLIDNQVDQAVRVGLTEEPPGGSRTPTTANLLGFVELG